MSFATWKAEYYPVDARDVSKADALAHSLRKWEGLRAKNLERHGMTQIGRFIAEKFDSNVFLSIRNTSCALCVHYLAGNCTACPLFVARGFKPCDDNRTSPYKTWFRDGDPEPMIALIQLAMKQQPVSGT